jgi:hypothetical protein
MAGRSVLSRGGVGGSSTFFNAANGLFHGTGSPSVGNTFLVHVIRLQNLSFVSRSQKSAYGV